MPIYDYRCSNCGYCYEVNHPMDAVYTGTCPFCGGKANKEMSATYGRLASGAVGNTKALVSRGRP